jgi:hypothetical protein
MNTDVISLTFLGFHMVDIKLLHSVLFKGRDLVLLLIGISYDNVKSMKKEVS